MSESLIEFLFSVRLVVKCKGRSGGEFLSVEVQGLCTGSGIVSKVSLFCMKTGDFGCVDTGFKHPLDVFKNPGVYLGNHNGCEPYFGGKSALCRCFQRLGFV